MRFRTFGSQDGGELAAVDLDGDVLEDDAGPDGADHLLEACPRLHLQKLHFSVTLYAARTNSLTWPEWKTLDSSRMYSLVIMTRDLQRHRGTIKLKHERAAELLNGSSIHE